MVEETHCLWGWPSRQHTGAQKGPRPHQRQNPGAGWGKGNHRRAQSAEDSIVEEVTDERPQTIRSQEQEGLERGGRVTRSQEEARRSHLARHQQEKEKPGCGEKRS